MRVNNISHRVAELVLCITKRYKLKSISYSEEDINKFYNDVDETLRKPNHYMLVMGYFNAQVGKRTNPMEMATDQFGLELRNERGDTLVEWATSRKYNIMNTMFQKRAGRRLVWKNSNGVTKTEIAAA